MNDILLELDDLITITQDVWSSFLDLELTAVPPDSAALSGDVLTATVRISGAWVGSVRLECMPDHAAAAAAAMFARAGAGAGAGAGIGEEALDAFGELANVVSGNVKSLLPAPSVLSTPTVRTAASGSPAEATGPAEELLRQVVLVATFGPLHVSIWKAGTS